MTICERCNEKAYKNIIDDFEEEFKGYQSGMNLCRECYSIYLQEKILKKITRLIGATKF
jgi:uncharacterized protein with PIN domain